VVERGLRIRWFSLKRNGGHITDNICFALAGVPMQEIFIFCAFATRRLETLELKKAVF